MTVSAGGAKPHELNKPAVISMLPTSFGVFTVYGYCHGGKEHVALTMGDVCGQSDVLCRVHSECLTGEVFHSLRCDCKEQLERGMECIAKAARGVFIYLRQEGRGIGLIEKLRAYNLQDEGADTVDANVKLGHPIDARDYKLAADILAQLDVRSVHLLTNNPNKVVQLEKYGVTVAKRIPLVPDKLNEYNKKYLQTKISKLGHSL